MAAQRRHEDAAVNGIDAASSSLGRFLGRPISGPSFFTKFLYFGGTALPPAHGLRPLPVPGWGQASLEGAPPRVDRRPRSA
ncbi:hypothetical protein ACFY30_37395 [Streptomyces sp. NPDC000345]|uniref:hypothetical protein n=1 Tax=Streptomyces sp. NPDC000345 TaxID=3364537 RepID=UPI0036936D31